MPAVEPASWSDLTNLPDATAKRGGRPSTKDRVKRYRNRLDVSKRWRKDEGYDATWTRLIDLYRNKHFSTAELQKGDRIAVNIAFATINVIAPSVSINYPKITVASVNEATDPQAAIAEAVLNYWWKHYDYRTEFRLAVDDFLQIGHGWIKVGYRYSEKPRPLSPEEQFDYLEQQRKELDEWAQQNPDLAGDLPGDSDLEAPEAIWETDMDAPFVERVSPFDVFIDPEATSLHNAKWIAQRIVRDVEDVKRDRRYKNRSKVEADTYTNTRWRDSDHGTEGSRTYADDIHRVTLYEFYDIQQGTVSVFAEHGDYFLVDPRPMPYSYGIPFVMMRNYNVPDYFYPLGDLEALEPLQRELNAIRSAMMNDRKQNARKYMVDENKLTTKLREGLQSDEDGLVIPVEGPLDDTTVKLVPREALDAQMYQYTDVIEQDLTSVSGVSEYQRGELPETRRTATEASIIQDSANARASDKLAIIETSIREIAERLLQLAQTYLTGEHVARLTGLDGTNLWVPFTRDDVQGEFDFEVEAGSTQPSNETFRRQQALQLLQTLQPYAGVEGMQAQGAVINARTLIEHVLREGFGLKNPAKFMLAEMDPMMMMQMMAQEQSPEGGGEEGEGGSEPAPPKSPQGEGKGDVPLPPSSLNVPGMDAIPPKILAQLAGQINYKPNNMR